MRDFQDLEEQAEARPEAPTLEEALAGLALFGAATYLIVHIVLWAVTSLMEVIG